MEHAGCVRGVALVPLSAMCRAPPGLLKADRCCSGHIVHSSRPPPDCWRCWVLFWKAISQALGEIFNLFLLTVSSAQQIKIWV